VRDPHSIDAHLELAEVFLQEANLPAAQLQLDQAATLAPNSAAVLARSGELLVLAGKQAEGLSKIDQALKKDRDETLDALGLPVNDRINGNSASAELLAMCRKASENLKAMQTPTPAAEVALAALDARSGDFDAAERAYQQLAAAPPVSRPSVNVLAQAQDALHAHHYDAAEAALLRWLAVRPADLSARFDLVVVRRQISMGRLTVCLPSRRTLITCINFSASFTSIAEKMTRHSRSILPWLRLDRISPTCTSGSGTFIGSMAMQTTR